MILPETLVLGAGRSLRSMLSEVGGNRAWPEYILLGTVLAVFTPSPAFHGCTHRRKHYPLALDRTADPLTVWGGSVFRAQRSLQL